MILEVENKKTIKNVSASQLKFAIVGLRSYGPSSFASLTDEHGNYLQVAGGGITCMLERRDISTGRHYRGYQDTANNIYPDGTILAFGGGEIKLLSDEWLNAPEVLEVFIAFLDCRELPVSIKWRDVTEIFKN